MNAIRSGARVLGLALTAAALVHDGSLIETAAQTAVRKREVKETLWREGLVQTWRGPLSISSYTQPDAVSIESATVRLKRLVLRS